MYIINLMIKLGIFFFIAYLNSVFELIFLKYAKRLNHKNASFAPNTYLPLFQGILLPILTIIAIGIPIGFNRNVYNTLLEEADNYVAKIVALGFNLVLFFLFILTLKIFPEITVITDGLVNLFIQINLYYIIFNVLPLFPSIMSYLVIYKSYHIFLKLKGIHKAYSFNMGYQHFTYYLMLIVILIDRTKFFNARISTLVKNMLSKSTLLLSLLTGVLIVKLVIITFYFRKSMIKYHSELKDHIQDIFEERKEL